MDNIIFGAHLATLRDTKRLGKAVARFLHPKDVVALTGELGAGKTSFVRCVLSALGANEAIISPSFPLVQIYNVPMGQVAHADYYRLNSKNELPHLGLDDMEALIFVEWADLFPTPLLENALKIHLAHLETDGRAISIKGNHQWVERLKELME